MPEFLSAPEIGTGGAMTLPGEFYTSPEVFQREQDLLFLDRWLCAGREEAIRETGEFFVRSIDRESVIVLRDGRGRVRAFHNVCRHRGARLCEEAQGRFGGAIRCPYHSWAYDLDGALRSAPTMDDVEGFCTERYPLRSAAAAVWEGFVFVSLAEGPAPFAASHAPLIGRFGQYHLPRLRALRRIEYNVRANWKLVFENYSECYHCPMIHRPLAKLSPSDSGRNDLASGPFLGGYMEVPSGAGSLSLSGEARGFPVGELPEEETRRVYYYSIFPNMLLSLHPEYAMVHTLWPVSPEHTRIECEWLFHPEAAAQPGFDPDDAVGFWDRVNREDWRICEVSQLGVSSRAYTPGPYSPREALSAEFDREVLRGLE